MKSRESGWRADPAWRLVSYDPAAFPDGPPAAPTKDAELAQPDAWASLYRGNRIVATWARTVADTNPPIR